MSILTSGYIRNAAGTFMICIDLYNDDEIKGRIYCEVLKEPLEFQSLISFLKQMEQILNTFDYPQTSMRLRRFKKGNKTLEYSKELPPLSYQREQNTYYEPGNIATVQMSVLFRENASWQGNVRWIEGGKKENFRSTLELIFLMDSIFSGDTIEKNNKNHRYQKKTAV